MSRLLVRSFAVSIDGFGAGPDQDLEHPLGVRGEELMEWFFHTRTWRAMHGGGTEFRFVTEGTHPALQQARAVAGVRDIRVDGGVSTIRQFLQAGLLDELHLAIPIVLGRGEALFQGLDLRRLGYECAEHRAGERAMHVWLRNRAA